MKPKVILEIDTSDTKSTHVGLTDGTARIFDREFHSTGSSQTILPAIETALSESGYATGDITEVRVNTGPGSFTGIRVGITVAKTIGMSLGIPVNGRPASDPIPCVYEGDRWG